MKTELRLERRPIMMGAGLSTTRWIVFQDNRIKELFIEKEQAEKYINKLKEEWSSQDE